MAPDLDVRLFLIPSRDHVISNLCDQSRLPHMALWECEGQAVRIEVNGCNGVFNRGDWRPFDPWELLSGGIPLSFFEFNLRWPTLVSCEEYLASFESAQQEPERASPPRSLRVLAGVPDPRRRSWLTWRGGTMVQRSPKQWKRQ